jgi:SAM-dependent methyltransferase
MSYNIDSKTYNKLYAKYLRGNRTKEMVDLAGSLKGKRILDLCCGGCRLSREVLKRGPKSVCAVDESLTILDPIVPYRIPSDEPINKICMTVDDALTELTSTFNVIFCQQGVNYWFQAEHAELIKRALAPKGVFIFNTFNKRPPTRITSKSYIFNKRSFMEVAWMVKDTVKHVQIAEGMDPHFTEFRWIRPEEFKIAFRDAGLDVGVITEGSTDIYICRKC